MLDLLMLVYLIGSIVGSSILAHYYASKNKEDKYNYDFSQDHPDTLIGYVVVFLLSWVGVVLVSIAICKRNYANKKKI